MHILFERMKYGTKKQQHAHNAILELGILKDMKEFQPVLCGTVPLGIDTAESDLDIIMEVYDLDLFEERIHQLYSKETAFRVKRTSIRGEETAKVNFQFKGYEFELFGQAVPVYKQNAYLHMLIEHGILQTTPDLKSRIIVLKHNGLNTEQAFCDLLEIKGDPYEGLKLYGIECGLLRSPLPLKEPE
ncbi:DUF4269 domain-containing protein [Rossellomorea aquimaris]|nr:DUF4269 domain-containing protein [Rossellomorea vietnamensis]